MSTTQREPFLEGALLLSAPFVFLWSIGVYVGQALAVIVLVLLCIIFAKTAIGVKYRQKLIVCLKL